MKVALVGGCGHVGLPLGVSLAVLGFDVVAFDVDRTVVAQVNKGISPFKENLLDEYLISALGKKFIATTNPSVLSDCDVVIMIVGTPLDSELKPITNQVVNVLSDISEFLRDGQLLILRSTVYPGSTRQIEEKLQNIGLEISVVFCPERIIEGYAIEELHKLPQVIGARNDKDFEKASQVFSKFGIDLIRTNPEEAELVKLFTNSWRYIKFAAANEFWEISTNLGIDFNIVRDAIRMDYPRASDLPGAGFAAGPCLFKDTKQLSASSNSGFKLGEASIEINEGLPKFIVDKLKEKFDLKQMSVGILGMAFKAESDDIRSSLSYSLMNKLQDECRNVHISDPFVKGENRLISLEDLIEKCDIIIIGAPHSQYSLIKFHKHVVDVWNLLDQPSVI
jgi:UDP-N-acetyl-D-mannosaminuronic acid dehydrogenase